VGNAKEYITSLEAMESPQLAVEPETSLRQGSSVIQVAARPPKYASDSAHAVEPLDWAHLAPQQMKAESLFMHAGVKPFHTLDMSCYMREYGGRQSA
jgi:hypothetical protein